MALARERIADVFRFAAEGGVLEGETPVADFNRLADWLAERVDAVRWRLAGRLDAEGGPRLDLGVAGRLVLRCQRCLEGMAWDLALDAVLQPVRAGQVLPRDELENDEFDVIEVDGDVDVLSLLEDEIILALPIAPRHEDCGVSRRAETDGGARGESPFGVLAGLRGGGR
ncbi:MAG: YceD family protein [Azoarcus sp.]|jgi:uncharacterized protein|nr:YceD family protein [Azoarcus sp.]